MKMFYLFCIYLFPDLFIFFLDKCDPHYLLTLFMCYHRNEKIFMKSYYADHFASYMIKLSSSSIETTDLKVEMFKLWDAMWKQHATFIVTGI